MITTEQELLEALRNTEDICRVNARGLSDSLGGWSVPYECIFSKSGIKVPHDLIVKLLEEKKIKIVCYTMSCEKVVSC